MSQTPREVIIAYFAFMVFWIAIVALIFVGARYWPRVRGLHDRMLGQWTAALGIAMLCWFSIVASGRGVLNPTPVGVFFEALVGLALAQGIAGFEPLPVVQAIRCRDRTCFVKIAQLLLIALVVVVPAMIAGGIGMTIGQQVFHEVNRTQEAQNSMQYDVLQLFFAFLSGAGIAEETVYRLIVVSLVWRLTGRASLGVVAGALLFAAYHLSPLNGLYLTFWKFPVSQFLSTVFIGLIWGYLYVKRGYETAVLGHTFQNWVPIALFTLMPT